MERILHRMHGLLIAATASGFGLFFVQTVKADSDVYQRVIQSTGLVEVMAPGQSMSWGTCWIVDSENRLAISCAHVVGNANEVLVYFPATKDGDLVHDYATYRRRMYPIRARVVHREPQRDLALLALDSLPENVKELPLAEIAPGPGSTVHSIGNSGIGNGELWRYTSSTVRVVHRMRMSDESSGNEKWVIKTQAPINPGDSGGPLVNGKSELVGVVMAVERDTRLVALNVDVREVKAFLKAGRDALKKIAESESTESAPIIAGSWKAAHINMNGDRTEGDCRFSPDGSFEMSFPTPLASKRREISGKYACANGVLQLVCDGSDLRTAMHWARKDRFTVLNDGMLIFDRIVEVAEYTASAK